MPRSASGFDRFAGFFTLGKDINKVGSTDLDKADGIVSSLTPELTLDTPDEDLKKLYHENFPETMEVRGHIYFRFDNEHADKIIFNHPTELFPDSHGTMTHHMGELQGDRTYVVGPYSTHPSGELYELKKDLPIVTISYDRFIEVFGDFMKKKKQHVITNHVSTSWKGENVTDIPIGNIVSFNGLRTLGDGCLQGPHPKHGSDNGMNFRIDSANNTWYCFRCQSGGGPSELIGVMEGIIDCYSAGPSCFTQDQAREVIKVARDKYGLSVTELQQNLGDVRGWANSVSILKLADKNNMRDCPDCSMPFKFTDSHGLYYCETCKYGGGLKKFAHMISKRDISDSQEFNKLKKEYESEGEI